MVVGFEEITKDLTEADLLLVRQFMSAFKKRVGRENKITASEIQLNYRNRGEKLNGAKIRGVVHHIRYHEDIIVNNKRYFLISDNSGYWISCDPDEIQKFAQSLEQRAGSILSIKNAVDIFLNGHASKKFIEQGDLFGEPLK